VHEQFNKSSQSGNYDVIVADRFMVSAHGYKIEMDTLKQAVAAVDLGKLEGMKDQGVKQKRPASPLRNKTAFHVSIFAKQTTRFTGQQ
jgi:hypothetical protein